MLTLETGICNNNRRGITLLEIVVVVFILSLSAAIIMPSFSYFGSKKIKWEAKRVASILRYLNENAITTKESTALTIDFKKKLLHYNSHEGTRRETIDTLHFVETQSKGIISEGELILFFSNEGAAESFNIHLSDKNSEFVIAFHHLSGRVKILER